MFVLISRKAPMGYHKSTFTRLFSRKPAVPLIEANHRQQAQDRERLKDNEIIQKFDKSYFPYFH